MNGAEGVLRKQLSCVHCGAGGGGERKTRNDKGQCGHAQVYLGTESEPSEEHSSHSSDVAAAGRALRTLWHLNST